MICLKLWKPNEGNTVHKLHLTVDIVVGVVVTKSMKHQLSKIKSALKSTSRKLSNVNV